MTRVEAALEDLVRLRNESSALDAELAPWSSELTASLERAWTTSSSVLGARGDLDQQLWAQLRVGAAVAEATDAAAARLARAGAEGSALRVVPRGSTQSPAGRLAFHLATGQLAGLAGRIWGRLEDRFSGNGRRLPSHVVRSRTESYGAEVLMADGSISLIWEEISDGTVRLTTVQSGGIGVGVGWGAEVVGSIEGLDLGLGGGSISADGRLVLSAVQAWTFPDKQAAEQFWKQHRSMLLGQVLIPGGSIGAAIMDRLHDSLEGEGGLPPSDRAYVEIGLEAALGAGLGLSSALGSLLGPLRGMGAAGGAAASYTPADRVRLHRDGTVTLITAAMAVAGADFGAAIGPAAMSGQATAGANVTVEVTTNHVGELREVVLRTAFRADPGRPLSLPDALGVTSAASSLNTDLHDYHTTLTLDLTDLVVRDLIETSLGVDLDTAVDQVQAVLATVSLHPALVRTARVSVLEQAPPQDGPIKVGVDLELGPLDVRLGGQGGTTTRTTRASWEKPPGSTVLARLG